jgi:hypothetical protein
MSRSYSPVPGIFNEIPAFASQNFDIFGQFSLNQSIDIKDVAVGSRDFWFLARLRRRRRFE